MQARFPRIVIALALAALGYSQVVPAARDANATYHSLRPAAAHYLQGTTADWFMPALAMPPTALPVLPNSTLGSQGPGAICSVASDGTNPVCSAAAQGDRCSAEIDSEQGCSAFASPGPGASCSTLAKRSFCSALQPQLVPAQNPAQCSARSFAEIDITCSAVGTGKRQSCSAQNPAAIAGNTCSAFDQFAICSVLNAGANSPSFCTVGIVATIQGPAFCSVFTVNAQCSVSDTGLGICSAFKNAPANDCSVSAGGGGHCSVINGAAGTQCRVP